MKIITPVLSVILGLIIALLAFVYISPDYDMYIVRSGSMTPAINTGDVVFVGPVNGIFSDGIGPGTIITYKYGNELITHRIVSIQNGALITMGDALEDPDINPVQMSQVVGTYLFKIPKLGYLVNFMHTKIGWYLVVIVPAIIFLALIFREIVREVMHKTST